MKRLIVGCGYLGGRVARRWLSQGDEVYAVTRRPGTLAELERIGLRSIVADVTDPATLERLPAADSIVYAVGYDRSGGRSMEEVYAGGVRNVLAALGAMPAQPRSFIYVSTTGVYPDAAGDWIDETTQPGPTREGGRASLAAEQALSESGLASWAVILRMAGIYGEGRVPFLDKLRAGEPIPAAADGWLNLIHADDAAAAVVAADRFISRQPSGAFIGPLILNITDGHPVRRVDYFNEIARRIGAPPPRLEPPDPSSHRAARSAASRRISNALMATHLDLSLAYPSFREGLQATLADD
jgi:nucleoside-diphosphate-sugar epimerase